MELGAWSRLLVLAALVVAAAEHARASCVTVSFSGFAAPRPVFPDGLRSVYSSAPLVYALQTAEYTENVTTQCATLSSPPYTLGTFNTGLTLNGITTATYMSAILTPTSALHTGGYGVGSGGSSNTSSTFNNVSAGVVLVVREGVTNSTSFVGASRCSSQIRFEWDYAVRVTGLVTINRDPALHYTTPNGSRFDVASEFAGTGGDNARFVRSLDLRGTKFLDADADGVVAYDDLTYCTGPSVDLSSAAPAPLRTSVVAVAVNLTADLVGLVGGDFELSGPVRVSNSTLSPAAADPLSYLLYLRADQAGAGPVSFTVRLPGGRRNDAFGSGNLPSNQLSLSVDAVAPAWSLSVVDRGGALVRSVAQFVLLVTWTEPVALGVGAQLLLAAGPGTPAAGSAVPVGPASPEGYYSAYNVTLTVGAEGVTTVSVNGSVASDGFGNRGSSAGAPLMLVLDVTPPALSLSGPPLPSRFTQIVVFLASSEPIATPPASTFGRSGVVARVDSVVPSDGGAGPSTSFNITLLVTSAAGTGGTGTLTVPAGAIADAAGNTNDALASVSVTYDPVQPTLSWSFPAGNPSRTSPVPVLLNFSEPVVAMLPGTPSAAALVLSGPGSGNLTATAPLIEVQAGLVYRLDLAPAVDDVAALVSVPAGWVLDLAGNPLVAASFSVRHDSRRPAGPVPYGVSPTSAFPAVVRVTFNEPVSALSAAGVSVTNGTVASVAAEPPADPDGRATTFVIAVEPTSAMVNFAVAVLADAVTDAAGNTNEATPAPAVFVYNRALVSAHLSLPNARVGPGGALYTNQPALLLTVRFTDNVSDTPALGAGSFEVAPAGTSLTDVTLLSPRNASCVLHMPAGAGAVVTVALLADQVADLATGVFLNTRSETVAVRYDPVPPSVVLVSLEGGPPQPISASQVVLRVRFSEPMATGTLDASASSTTTGALQDWRVAPDSADASQFLVTVGALPAGVSLRSVNVTLSFPVGSDLAGNLVAGGPSGISFLWDTQAPTVALSVPGGGDPANLARTGVLVTFSERVVAAPLLSSFVVLGGRPIAVAPAAGDSSGAVFLLTVEPAAVLVTVTVNLTAGAARDAAGNPSAASPSALRVHHDEELPVGSFVSSVTSPTMLGTFSVNLEFTELVTGLTADSVVVTGSSGAALASFSPLATVSNTFSLLIDAPADGAVDIALNPLGPGSDLAGNAFFLPVPSLAIRVDRTSPTVSVLPPALAVHLSPVSVRLLFSEPVFNLSAAGVVLTGATFCGGGPAALTGAAGGSDFSVCLEPSGGLVNVTVDVGVGTALDAAGNPNLARRGSFRFDNRTLSVNVTAGDGLTNPTRMNPIPLRAVFSRPVVGLTEAGLLPLPNCEVVPGSLAPDVSSGGVAYTFSVRPLPGNTFLLVGASVAAKSAQDDARNDNVASAAFSVTYDARPLLVTVRADGFDPTVVRSGSMPLLLTFNRAAGVTLADLSRITVRYGQASTPTLVNGSSPVAYSVVVTPDPLLNDVQIEVTVGDGAFRGPTGTLNDAAPVFRIAYATDRLGITCATVPPSAGAGLIDRSDPLRVDVVFSVSMTELQPSSLVIVGATLSSFACLGDACDGRSYTVLLAPLADVVTVELSVPEDAVFSLAGAGTGNRPCFVLVLHDRTPPTTDLTLINSAFDPIGYSNLTGSVGSGTNKMVARPSERGANVRPLASTPPPTLDPSLYTNEAAVRILVRSNKPTSLTGLAPVALVTGGAVASFGPPPPSLGLPPGLDGLVWMLTIAPSAPAAGEGYTAVSAALVAGVLRDVAGNLNVPGLNFTVVQDVSPPSAQVAVVAVPAGATCSRRLCGPPGWGPGNSTGTDPLVAGEVLKIYTSADSLNLTAIFMEAGVLLTPGVPASAALVVESLDVPPNGTDGSNATATILPAGSGQLFPDADPFAGGAGATTLFSATLTFVGAPRVVADVGTGGGGGGNGSDAASAALSGAEIQAALRVTRDVVATVALAAGLGHDLAGNPSVVGALARVVVVRDVDRPGVEIYWPTIEAFVGLEVRALLVFSEPVVGDPGPDMLIVNVRPGGAGAGNGVRVKSMTRGGDAATFVVILQLSDGLPEGAEVSLVLRDASVSDRAGNLNFRTLIPSTLTLTGRSVAEGRLFTLRGVPFFDANADPTSELWQASLARALSTALGQPEWRLRVDPTAAGRAVVTGSVLPATNAALPTPRELVAELERQLCDPGGALLNVLAQFMDTTQLEAAAASSSCSGESRAVAASFEDCSAGFDSWISLLSGSCADSECGFWFNECRWWVWALAALGALLVLCCVWNVMAMLLATCYDEETRMWLLDQNARKEEAELEQGLVGERMYGLEDPYLGGTTAAGDGDSRTLYHAMTMPRLVLSDVDGRPGVLRRNNTVSANARYAAAAAQTFAATDSFRGAAARSRPGSRSPPPPESLRGLARLPSRLDGLNLVPGSSDVGRRVRHQASAQSLRSPHRPAGRRLGAWNSAHSLQSDVPHPRLNPIPLLGGPAAEAYRAGSVSRNITGLGQLRPPPARAANDDVGVGPADVHTEFVDDAVQRN